MGILLHWTDGTETRNRYRDPTPPTAGRNGTGEGAGNFCTIRIGRRKGNGPMRERIEVDCLDGGCGGGGSEYYNCWAGAICAPFNLFCESLQFLAGLSGSIAGALSFVVVFCFFFAFIFFRWRGSVRWL